MTEHDARDFMDALGAEINYWRKRRGLSREELGKLVDVSPTTVGRVERGDESAAASAASVWRMANHLGINLSDLVRRAEESTLRSGEATPEPMQINTRRRTPVGDSPAMSDLGE